MKREVPLLVGGPPLSLGDTPLRKGRPSPGPCGDQNNFNQAAQQHGGVAALPASLFSDSRATNVDECQRLPWQRNDDVLRAALASSTAGAKAGIANAPWQNGRLVVHKLSCPPLVHEHHQLVADAAVVFRVNATIQRLMHQKVLLA